jgi:dTDP-4-amino-4,6-dideoxygalactose transaminase
VFNYGDVSTCSFHATKLFHTAEGGCIITNHDELSQQVTLYHQFGHFNDDYYCMGINGKSSELHAALGLCNLNYVDKVLGARKKQWLFYYALFKNSGLEILRVKNKSEFNYSYFPIVFKTEESLLETTALLRNKEILPRRYFYPSLNNLPYINYQPMPVSESVAKRILCLPLYHELGKKDQLMIAEIVLHSEKQFAE